MERWEDSELRKLILRPVTEEENMRDRIDDLLYRVAAHDLEESAQDNARWWLRMPSVMDIPVTDSASGLWLPDIETIFGTSTPDAEELEDNPTICDNQMSWEDMMQLQGEEDEK